MHRHPQVATALQLLCLSILLLCVLHVSSSTTTTMSDKVAVLGGKGGLPPAWVLAGLEPPQGVKDMGSWKAAVYTPEQQARLGVDEEGHKHDAPRMVGGPGVIGPAWTRGEIEPPQGEKNMGSWTAAVYTPEQQARLNVDEFGHKKQHRVVVGGKGGLPPAWIQAGLEPPQGEEDHGSFKTAVYTAEQQARLGVDAHGNPADQGHSHGGDHGHGHGGCDHGHGHKVGGRGLIGPAWTRGEIEAPAGEKNMGTWTAAVYTPEQQARLGIDEFGTKK